MAQVRSRRGRVTKDKMNIVAYVVLAVLLIYSVLLVAAVLFGLNTSLREYHSFKRDALALPDFSSPDLFRNYQFVINAFSFQSEQPYYISPIFGQVMADKTTFVFGDLLLNSIFYCVIGSFVKTFVAMLCGFLVAKYRYKFSKLIYVAMLIVLAVPIVGSIPAMVNLLQTIGIYDTYLGMFILNLNFTGFYFFVFVAHFESFPDSYLEAAEIDGANQFSSCLKIVFPMTAKLFWTVFLLNFIVLWNDYQTPLLYYPNHPTLAYGVYKMYRLSSAVNGVSLSEIPIKCAGCMLLVIPILTLFLATKNILLGNMSAGGIKEWKNEFFYLFCFCQEC